jgi:hypothetical protein
MAILREAVEAGKREQLQRIENELVDSGFSDPRLQRRFSALVKGFEQRLGASVPWACQDWAAVKAAYRFLANDRVSEAEILAGHFQATRSRLPKDDSPVLVLHDTTEFSYRRKDMKAIGLVRTIPGWTGRGKKGRPHVHTVCGVLMHSSLAVTPEGLPLGLIAIKFWTRKKFKHTQALRGKICPTRVPIETKESIRWLENLRQATAVLAQPQRCVHVGDRESDIYELFCAAREEGTHFLVRTCVDRLAVDGTVTIAKEMKRVAVRGVHRIEVIDRNGESRQAALELRYQRMVVCPPIGKHKKYPSLTLTVLHAQERNPPSGCDPIVWKLLTDLEVRSRQQAIEKLEWYAQRWKLETFHKILKSGCRAEESRLRTADRLVNLLAILCILSWRIFWMTMLNRTAPAASPATAFTRLETQILDAMIQPPSGQPSTTFAGYLNKLARLGGYLARRQDAPPGNKVVWRGLGRLTDLALGAHLRIQLVGK